MTAAERLLARFDRISEAPDAIARIRGFILDLAVTGKLVDQDPNDEPALVAVQRTRAHRTALEKAKLMKPAALPYGHITVGQDYLLPARWTTSTIAELCDLQTGATPDRTRSNYFDGDIPWLRSGDINRADIFECQGRISSQGLDASNCKILPKGSVLIALNGQGKTRGMVAVLHIAAACNQSLVAMIPLMQDCLTSDWLRLNLKSRYSAIRELTGKDERRGLNMRLLSCFEIAVPPVAEQRRIVAKVDELMVLCDRLEAAQTERERRRDQLVAASLNRLNEPEADAPVWGGHVRFNLDHLSRLVTQQRHVEQFRQTILNLAVRGRLVQQSGADGSASELLACLAAEKARQHQTGALKKQHAPARVDIASEPFDVPPSWRWVTVDECFAVGGGIQKTPARTPKDHPYPYVGVGNVYRGRLDLSELKRFELFEGELERFRLMKGDILVVEGNGSANEIGRCAMWDGEVPDCVHQNHIIRCRPFDLRIGQYVLRYLNSPNGIEVMQRLAITTSGLFSLSVGKIRTIAVPLPPLAEQHRIVAKVDELMAVCDRLETSLATAQAASRRLLDAVLHAALATHSDQGLGIGAKRAAV